jgi:AraC family transcriptional regulator
LGKPLRRRNNNADLAYFKGSFRETRTLEETFMNDTTSGPSPSAAGSLISPHGETHPFGAGDVQFLNSRSNCATPGAPLDACASLRGTSVDRLCDAVMELFHAVDNTLNDELDCAYMRLQRAARALHIAPPSPELDSSPALSARPGVRGGLAPWQARIVKTHIETHLDTRIRMTELAQFAQISPFHFCRVFRVSFGHSPHNYITRRRIERAQGLMLTTNLPLVQIAIDCGLSDQPHLTKLFRRFVGETPREWRRARSEAVTGRHLPMRASICHVGRLNSPSAACVGRKPSGSVNVKIAPAAH